MGTDLETVIQSEVSQKEKRDIVYKHIYMQPRKMVQMNRFAGRIHTDVEKQRMATKGGKWRGVVVV